jgi:choline-sulfatase
LAELRNLGSEAMTRVSRRDFIQRSTAAAVCALGGCATAPHVSRGHGRPPNILFVYTDDQAWWSIRALAEGQAHTPNTDALFAQSVVLTNSFVTTPVCSPSRAGLLTSRYGTEVGITDWINPRGGPHQRNEADLGLDPALPTWVRQLRDAGYRTGLVGKWHLGTQDRYQPRHFGYDHFMGFREGGMKVADPELEVNGQKRTFTGLTMDILTKEAISFLTEGPADQPFLLALHYRAPHSPWLPVRDDDMAPYDGIEMAVPDPHFPDLDTARVQRSLREYLASVTGIDRNLGRLLARLDAQGLRENTVVIFTSDNGYNIGHHGIIHKGNGGWITRAAADIPGYDPRRVRPNMFENSIRVPTAVRWPAALRPGRVDRTVSNLDWYPTVLAMCGLDPQPGATIHGRNALPLLRGHQIPWDDDLYGEYSQHHYTETDLRMFRTPEWKLVRDFRNEGRDELYHLATDPGEARNLIDEPDARSSRDSLDGRLRARMEMLA